MTTKNASRTTRLRTGARTQPDAKPSGVRERILDAALDILREAGIRHLTQVKVAGRAGVRQSHLTYYFATRDDLLEAVTERAVEGLASGLHRMIADPAKDHARLVESLARAVTDRAHMRMFVAMIVEADDDAIARRLLRRGTERMEAALADALGGDHARERARLTLAAVWGLGLYLFLMDPRSGADPTRAYLSWLAETPRSGATGRGQCHGR